MTHILEIDSVQLAFGDKRILSDIYIKCETNQVTGLIGRNGSGKSCLLNIICGNLNPQSKSVRIDKHYLSRVYPHINYLPQFHFVPGHLKINRIFSDYSISSTEFLHHFPEFNNKMGFKFKKLSGGHRRLIEVYLIICQASSFSLLDEPFSNLMPIYIEKIKQIILAKKNKGFIITDHRYKDVMDISSHNYLLLQGKAWPVHYPQDLIKRGYINTL